MVQLTSAAQKTALAKVMETTRKQIPGTRQHTANLDKIYTLSLVLAGHPEAKAGMIFICQQATSSSVVEKTAAAILRTWKREEVSLARSGLHRTLARGIALPKRRLRVDAARF